ncbi:hypothetical protein [Pseudalkalibacillus berkeleyi]|uniref:Uncharacterized protein n=1 Tax=Pseudalkalibacillus berkeleyi TaxID=1069813 RepID=A0ABS9GXN1_9BACL|nr:hypothetical protein [Pseudalkalibacillus berkeleyi]MCF6136416.1 hypothetical protein [Pseudalkalibacillus berkeleyi]
MKAAEMEKAVDFKKLTIVDLQISLQESENRLKFVTSTAFIEADVRTHEPESFNDDPTLGRALGKFETNPNVDYSDRDVINIHSCVYLQNVKITPISAPDSATYLDEFVIFTDHILGLALADVE